jgi:hypothetical protein
MRRVDRSKASCGIPQAFANHSMAMRIAPDVAITRAVVLNSTKRPEATHRAAGESGRIADYGKKAGIFIARPAIQRGCERRISPRLSPDPG